MLLSEATFSVLLKGTPGLGSELGFDPGTILMQPNHKILKDLITRRRLGWKLYNVFGCELG